MKRILLALTFTFAGILFFSTARCQSQSKTADSTGLSVYRAKIDSLDKALIQLLGERERVVKEVGIYKAEHHIAPLQAARFQDVLNRAIAAGAKEGLSATFITQFMNSIHDESLRIEKELQQAK
jgi:chorismate mutase